MLEPSPLRDERVCLALQQLAHARGHGEHIAINRAESLVISLLLPFALERSAAGSDPVSVADIQRVTAARLTRAVMTWDLVSPPEHAAVQLVRAAMPPRSRDPVVHRTEPARGSVGPQRLPRPADTSVRPPVGPSASSAELDERVPR